MLSQRPYGVQSGAAVAANQTALNVQGQGSATLPNSQAVVTSSETKILNALTLAALVASLPAGEIPDSVEFDLYVSGYIKATASGTIALGLYADALTTVTAGNCLHKTASAPTQGIGTYIFKIHAHLTISAYSGLIEGSCGGYAAETIDPEITNTNFPAVTLTNNPVANFSLSLTSSGAAAATPTTITVTNFSLG